MQTATQTEGETAYDAVFMNQDQMKFHSNEREIDQRVETINAVAEKMHEIKSIAAGLQSMATSLN